MPREMSDNDWKTRVLTLALIEQQSNTWSFREEDLNRTMPRYLRELKKLGVEHPPFFPDCVWDRYPEVHDAIVYAMGEDAITASMTSDRITKRLSSKGFITSGLYITPEEGGLALQAAKIAISKFHSRELDDDVPKEETGTATH